MNSNKPIEYDSNSATIPILLPSQIIASLFPLHTLHIYNTLYHKLPLSSNTIYTHLPSKHKLNSFDLITVKPPFSLDKHKVSHFIQDNF